MIDILLLIVLSIPIIIIIYKCLTGGIECWK